MHDALLPVRDVREGGGCGIQGGAVVRGGRGAVRAAVRDREVPLDLLLHLPLKDA